MYLNEFIRDLPRSETCRYYLSGNNIFFKNWLIQYIAKREKKSLKYVKDKKEYKAINTNSLFGGQPIIVLGPKVDKDKAQNFRIKIGGGKEMPKKYKKMGYFDITCNNMFPNHVEEFAGFCCSEAGLFVSKQTLKFLCYVTENDPYSIDNAIKLLAIVQDYTPLTDEQIQDYCKVLSSQEFYEVMDSFCEERFEEFLSRVESSQIKMNEFMLSMTFFLFRLEMLYAFPVAVTTWGEKKMQKASKRLAKYNYKTQLLPFLRNVLRSGGSANILLLQLKLMVAYMKGFIPVLVEDE
jgi:hypothetical protein